MTNLHAMLLLRPCKQSQSLCHQTHIQSTINVQFSQTCQHNNYHNDIHV